MNLFILAHVWLMDAYGNAIRVAGFIFHEGMPSVPGIVGF